MNNTIKKVISLLICLSIAFNAFAGDSKASYTDIDTFVLSIIEDMLDINGYDDLEDISLSDKIPVYNLNGCQENKNIYLIIYDDNIIALLVAAYMNNQYYAALEMGVPEEIVDIYKDGIPFALCNYEQSLILHTDNRDSIVKSDSEAIVDIGDLNYDDIELREISIAYDSITADRSADAHVRESNSLMSTYGAYTVASLGVPYVANGNSPADGAGMCWAASIAAISNYRSGTNYTALSLYNNLWSYYSGYGSGNYPTGTATWKKRAFSYCGLTYTYLSSGMSGSQISAALSAQRPIMMDIFANTAVSTGHSIVLKGIYVYGNGNNYYQIMDPNTSGTISVTVSDSVLNNSANFSCTLSTGTYTNWRYSYY